jgi:hypothetical protein
MFLWSPDVGIYRFTSLFRHLELHKMFGFALADSGPIGCQSVRTIVFDLETYNVAASELAVDREIEQCEIIACLAVHRSLVLIDHTCCNGGLEPIIFSLVPWNLAGSGMDIV